MRRPNWYCLAVVVFLPFFYMAFFSHPPDIEAKEQVLSAELSELSERLKRAEMLNRQRWFDLLHILGKSNISGLNYPAAAAFGGGSMFDLQLPTIFHYLSYLYNASDALLPALKISKGRTDVSMVLGVPTVRRDVQSYLIATLRNLIENMNEQEKESALIVVFIAEIDTNFVTEKAKEIQSEFGNEIDRGLLEVVSPPASYYPDMEKLRITLNDAPMRVRWRTKQVLDFAYLMMYAQGKGTYYLQLEDDILTKPGYMTTIREFANKQNRLHDGWLLIEFSQLGFIGKLFKSMDLSKFVAFFLIFYNDKPVDWLLQHLVQTKVCRFDKDVRDCRKRKADVWISYKPSLFQHVGTHSSLKGKVQKLKDRNFGRLSLHIPHPENPPAKVLTSLQPFKAFTLVRAYQGLTYFWGILPHEGDNVTFQFVPPVKVYRYLFRTGNPESPDDRFYNTTVEVLPDRVGGSELGSEYQDPNEVPPPAFVAEKTSSSAYNNVTKWGNGSVISGDNEGWEVVGQFVDGVATGVLPQRYPPLKAMRLRVNSNSSHWIILSEIFIDTNPPNSTTTHQHHLS